MINTLPEFESRQVLTSDELNWLTCYLDTQNRQSRRFLIGCGLIGGLQVKLVNNSVQISNGCGLTSAGHIVSLQNPNADFTTFTKVKKYEQKNKEKLAFHYLSDLDLTDENYSNSVDNPSLYFPNFKGEVLELFEETVNGPATIVANNLKGKVVMLFAEIIQKELKDCEDDNCQERGKKYLFTTKALVISKEDAIFLLSNEYSIQTTSENEISKLAFPWLQLPNLNILKPAFSNITANSTFDENSIIQEYTRCIKDFTDGIISMKSVLDESLKNLKNYCTSNKANFQIVDKLLAVITKTNVISGNNKQPILYQIVYDYLWTFTKAYREILLESQSLKSKVFTNESGYPNHIFAGILDNQNVDFDASISSSYTIFRHDFHSRFVQSEQAGISKNISILLNRLQQIVASFDETILTIKKEIKVTPGGNIFNYLSDQTIPFYLKQDVNSVWNKFASQPNLNQIGTKYTFSNESLTPSIKLNYNTLPSSFQGDHSFFRVEGTHGTLALTALNSVFQIRKKHGLPFEVLMLRLNEKAPFSHSFNFTINEDIESMYQVVRAELLKQIQLNTSYLGSLQLKSGKFNSIQSALIKALEASYFTFLGNLNLTILAKPLQMVLSDAVIASNITSSNSASFITNEVKFLELEARTIESKSVKNSAAKRESASISINSNNFISAQIFQPVLNFQIGVLFFNTLGNLVNSIKANDKFKNTMDISFYTHLLSVAKSMQKSEKTEVLFLMALQLFCALKLQDEYLSTNFLELDEDKYKDNLEDNLLPTCNAIVGYLKNQNTETVISDEILAEVEKREMLDYADRIKFDDDWVKIIQIDAENKKRNGGLGVENLLERFVKLHPSLSHGCGVPKGGTYIMVYDQSNTVTADFYLPYIISSHLRPIQYTVVENKTLTLSGTIKDESGKPVVANLIVGVATVLTDNQGFYNALVNENTTVKVICNVTGFSIFEQNVVIKTVPETLNIVLKKSESKFTTTIKFVDQFNKAIIKDLKLLNLATNQTELAIGGILKISDLPQKEFKYRISDNSFSDKEFAITIGSANKDETINLVQVATITIKISDNSANKFTPTLLKSIKITNPDLELDTSNAAKGLFVTKEAVDLSKPATAIVIYNNQTQNKLVNAGETINEMAFDAEIPDPIFTLNTLATIVYPPVTINVPSKIPSIIINKVIIPINNLSNIGKAAIVTSGSITLDKKVVNAPKLSIDNLDKINNAVYVFDSRLIMEGTDVSATNSIFTFNKALTNIEIRSLVNLRIEFKQIASEVELKSENFFCLVLLQENIKQIRTLLNV